MIKSIARTALINVILFIVLIILYFITGFLLGYGSNDNYKQSAWILFGGFVVTHLIINLIFISNPQKNSIIVVIGSCLYIMILYGIVAYIYR
jgi:hypothetical protein